MSTPATPPERPPPAACCPSFSWTGHPHGLPTPWPLDAPVTPSRRAPLAGAVPAGAPRSRRSRWNAPRRPLHRSHPAAPHPASRPRPPDGAGKVLVRARGGSAACARADVADDAISSVALCQVSRPPRPAPILVTKAVEMTSCRAKGLAAGWVYRLQIAAAAVQRCSAIPLSSLHLPLLARTGTAALPAPAIPSTLRQAGTRPPNWLVTAPTVLSAPPLSARVQTPSPPPLPSAPPPCPPPSAKNSRRWSQWRTARAVAERRPGRGPPAPPPASRPTARTPPRQSPATSSAAS